MKYFRTKDGRIIEFNDRICNSLPHAIGEPIDDNVGFYKGVEVIAQADTIEGLCDCYIFFNHGLEDIGIFCQPGVMSKEEYEEHRKDMPLKFELEHYNVEYFLGTWTIINNVPKLNIVAKIINGEGESQLL